MARTALTEAEKKAKAAAAEKAAAARKAALEKMTPDEKKAFLKKEKNEAFIRLANARVPKTVASIKTVTQLFAPNYAWTPEQAEKIINKLQDTLDILKQKASGAVEEKADTFSL